MKRAITSLSLLLFFALGTALGQAGDDRMKEVKAAMKGSDVGLWKRGGGFGFDLSGLGIANPRIGAGQNRFGIGGLGTFFADKKQDKNFWENNLSLQLGVVRIGGSEQDFQKGIDVFRGSSKAGRSITKNNKFYASALAIATTSILKTYAGNYLQEHNEGDLVISKFLNPVQLQFHPGVEWRPNEHFSALLSPVGYVGIFVPDEKIAAQNIHGNELGKTYRHQLVPSLNAGYKDKFLGDRVSLVSTINLTTNYLDHPFTWTALNFWQNNVSIALWKGLSLDLFGEAAYDHLKPVIKDSNNDGILDPGVITAPAKDGDLPTTTLDRLGRSTQWIGSFLLKYNMTL